MPARNYTLTQTAENDLREAKAWSASKWGKARTKEYFTKLHDAAQYAAKNHHSLAPRTEWTGDTGLSLYPVGAHYLVYMPVAENHIVIVAVLKQERDIATILSKGNFLIQRELKEIAGKLASGAIKLS